MATRATYKIHSHCFYIHWDGYPEGAAVYLWNMYQAMKTSKGGLSEAFLRGNDGAEFTGDHDCHGDTEWRYTLEGDVLTVEKAYFPDNAPKAWDVRWMGNWWEFVNANNEHIPEWSPLFPLPDSAYRCDSRGKLIVHVTDGAQLLANVRKASDELTSYAAKFPQAIGNIASLQSQLNRAVAALTQYGTQYPHAIEKVAA